MFIVPKHLCSMVENPLNVFNVVMQVNSIFWTALSIQDSIVCTLPLDVGVDIDVIYTL